MFQTRAGDPLQGALEIAVRGTGEGGEMRVLQTQSRDLDRETVASEERDGSIRGRDQSTRAGTGETLITREIAGRGVRRLIEIDIGIRGNVYN